MAEVGPRRSGACSSLRADDDVVLPWGPLFGDDVWDLSVIGLPAGATRGEAQLDFASIDDDHWRLLAKEYFWARLHETVPGSSRLPAQGARAEFSVFTIFARWLLDASRHPAGFNGRLSSLDHADLDAFAQFLRAGRAQPLSPGTIGVYLRLVERLHDYSAFFSYDALPFHPWRHRTPNRVAGFTRTNENKTPRIPQEVLGPFLHWALFYVETASADVLAAIDELAGLQRAQTQPDFADDNLTDRVATWIRACRQARSAVPARPVVGQLDGDERDANLTVIAAECGLTPEILRSRPNLRAMIGDAVVELGLEPWGPDRQPLTHPAPLTKLAHTKAEITARLEDYVERRRADGRGIPCWSQFRNGLDGQVNVGVVAAQIGAATFQRHHHPEAFTLLNRAVAELGGEPGGMDTPISLLPATGRPWRPRFGPNSVAVEVDHLRAACFVVCAYLSGMRDGELMEIRRDAHRLERSADGVINRHRVHSLVRKGRQVPEPATWVVTEHFVHAIEIMERLDGGDLVFARMPPSRQDAINRLRAHLDRLSGDDARVAVPSVDGVPWRFDTRQFRRTLAWFIGAQPFGVWAGAVQFKHRNVRSAMAGIGPAVFEGYVGTTPSGFPAEVELAKQAAADLYVEELAAAHATGATSAGGGATRVNAHLEELRAELADLGAPPPSPLRVVDEGRRKAMLRSVSRNLFVGPLTDCFFDPDTALCLRDIERSAATAPIIGRCQPQRCRNSRIGEHHLPAWEARLAQVRADLRLRDLPTLQRQHLAQQRDRLKAAIDQVKQQPNRRQ